MAGKKKYERCCVCSYELNIIDNPITKENPLPELCPSCKTKYWTKPLVERDLMVLQDTYLADPNNRDQEAFNEIIIIVEGLLHNIIASKLKGSAIYLEDEKRHDLVMESLLVFIEKYTNNSNFKIGNSFITYLQQMVLNPLYHPKKKLKDKLETSISTPIGSDKDGAINLGDLLEVSAGMAGSEDYILNTLQRDIQIDAISYILDSIFIQITKSFDVKTALIVLHSIYLQLSPNVTEDEVLEFWSAFNNETHLVGEYAMKLLYDFVREEIANLSEVMSYEDYLEKFGTGGSESSNDDVESEEDEESTIIIDEEYNNETYDNDEGVLSELEEYM